MNSWPAWQTKVLPKARQRNLPAMSFADMCEAVGVTPGSMSAYLGRSDAPKPIKRSRYYGSYYNGIEARTWCAALKKEISQ